MECDICARSFGARRKPFCLSCARAAIYEPRLEHLSALVERENAHKTVEAVLSPSNDGFIAALPSETSLVEVTESARKHGVQRMQAEQEAIDQRIAGITEQADLLRLQVEEYKQEAAIRNIAHEQRRREITTERQALDKQRPRVLEPVQGSIRKTAQRMEKTHNRTVDARALLCRETAELCGLRRRKRKSRDGSVKDEYVIGGIAVPDLRLLNTAQPDQLTASLEQICRLLALCCHYLSVRLPAEIILPHTDYPHPSIMPLLSSYQSTDAGSPGLTRSQSSKDSPSQSKTLDQRATSRPRVLFLDRPLPKLSKEDSKSYGLFVEGVTLLSWDIAWLCKTQGVTTINAWEDVCPLGRNLWLLLFSEETASRVARPRLDRNISTATDVTARSSAKSLTAPPASSVRIGSLSHANASHNLAGADGNELLRTWKLAAPARLLDKVKSYLLTEMSGAEWEMLDEREWNQEREDEEAVLVGGRRPSDEAKTAMSVMTVTGAGDEDADGGKGKGTSGWMKVRGRNGDG